MTYNIRSSAEKLNIAVIRLIVVATRGFDKTFFMCVSVVRLAVRPILSTAFIQETNH
jgi:hypothetical protein